MVMKLIRKMLICILALLMLLSAGCANNGDDYAPELKEPAGMEPDNITVGRGEICNIHTSEGLLLPQVHELSFGAGGLLNDVLVCVGSHVKEGDILARLDAAMFENALEAAVEELAYNEGVWSLSEEMARTQIRIAEVELEQLQLSGASKKEQELKAIHIAELKNKLEADMALWALSRSEFEGNIAHLEEQVAGSILTAPCDGTIVYSSADEGSYAMNDVGVFWLAEDTQLQISCDYITAEQISKAKRIYATLEGQVVEVEYVPLDRAEFISHSDNDEEINTVFRITDSGELDLESGMSAVVFLVMEHETDTLIIPSCALRQDSNGQFVYLVQADGSQIRQPVKRGIYNDAYVQITEGLKEGDVVYAGN